MASARRDLLNYAQFLKESGYLYLEAGAGEGKSAEAKAGEPATPPTRERVAKLSESAAGRPATRADVPESRVKDPTYLAGDAGGGAKREAAPVRSASAPPEPLSAEERVARAKAASERVAACTACQLCRTRTQTVYGTGSLQAKIVFIGEGPGAEEDRTGIPFVGRAGQLLDKMIQAIGFRRDEVYICNTVKCRPPENRDPEPGEKRACEPFLHEQLEIIQPQIIVALGAHAATWLTQTDTSIGRLRKKWHEYRRIPVMATYHPAFLLRSPNMKSEAWSDMQILHGRYNELNPGDARKIWRKDA